MNIRTRLNKIEKSILPKDELENARGLIKLGIVLGICDNDIDIEKEARRLAEEGWTLEQVLKEIADAGPSSPCGGSRIEAR